MDNILDNDQSTQYASSATFFDTNSYFIDEKINFFKFENAYKVFNDKGQEIGGIVQQLSIGQKILRLIINKKMLPFRLQIKDSTGLILASVSRGFTLWMSKITIVNESEEEIGFIKQKFAFFKPTFQMFSVSGTLIGEITGDWKAWNFIIKDASQNQIGTISKKWAGAMKEIFTSADKYNVSIDPAYGHTENKLMILSSAIAIDMIMKEKK